MRGTYVPGVGHPCELAIIGIAPGDEEVKREEPFVGPSGSILKGDLKDAGVNLNNCYRTNIFKYKLPNNEFKRYQEMGLDLREAMADLQEEINFINPNCILGLGDPVLSSLAGKSGKYNGINVWRGSILHSLGKKIVFTWHPAHELHSIGEDVGGTYKSWQRYVRKFDVKRAVEQSGFSDFRLPQRSFHIAGSSSDVYRFIERNRDEEFCAVDIESIEGIPVCIGLSFNPLEAMCIPLWNTLPIRMDNQRTPKKSYAYNLRVSTIPDPDLAYIWKILSALFLNTKVKFIGHNFKYDEEKLNHLGFFFHGLHWDTMIAAHCISSEMLKSLAFLTSIYTEEPYYKYEGKEFIPQKDKIEDFFYYNCKDACVTREIFNAQLNDLKSIPYGLSHATWRMKLHHAYMLVDKVGFKIDEDERLDLIYKYVQRTVQIEKEISDLTGKVINVGSPQQVSALLFEHLRIPKRKGTGEEVITGLLGNTLKIGKHDVERKVCELILDWRRNDKTLGYLKASPDYDGRMKTTFKITGTENFRTSTNILEQPIRPDKIGWAFQTISKHGDIGNDLRSVLVADIGYVLVNVDQSQAEARVCSLLANDEETLQSYDTIDKHALTASKFFGGSERDYSKKVLGYECPERFVGKTLRHAYHLDIGKHEAMVNVNTDARKYKINVSISEWKAGECLKILEKDTPRIKDVFHRGIQELLRKDRRIIGTYGASRYFYDESESRDLFKGAYSFIPQQTVSDKTKQVLLEVQKRRWDVRVVVESHDALTFLMRDKQSLYDEIEEIQSLFSIPIDFSTCSIPRRSLIIPTDTEIGYDYKNLDKYDRRKVA